MNITTLVNQKGGVGKTTTCLNVAVFLAAKRSKKVLVIDFDSSSNLTNTLYGNGYRELPSLYNVFNGEQDINDIIIENKWRVDLIPSNKNLADLQEGLYDSKLRTIFLKQEIEKIKKKYDFIFIDNPPSLSLYTINSLVCSNNVIIPVEPEHYSIEGLIRQIDDIKDLQEINQVLNFYILLTKFDARKSNSKQTKIDLKSAFGKKFFRTVIRDNVDLSYSQGEYKPIFFYDNKCNGAVDYQNLCKEILKI